MHVGSWPCFFRYIWGKKLKRAVILVTNDVEADQRVSKMAGSISHLGYAIVIVGIIRPHSNKRFSSPHSIVRFRLPILRGPLFYLLFNLNAFFYLLFHRSDVVIACDTDTLLAARLAKFFRRFRLVFDAHELFLDLPEIVGPNRRFTRAVWQLVERSCMPSVDVAFTVSDGVGREYANRYGKQFTVVRNVPLCTSAVNTSISDKDIVIYQGAINVGRGLELLIDAMHFSPDVELWIAGTGNLDAAIAMQAQPLMELGRIKLLGRVAPENLREITAKASIGVSLEEDMGLSYRYCLPNKLFDYILAGIPVLVSDLPEMRKLVESYRIGVVLKERTPKALANAIKVMLVSDDMKKQWQQNLKVAATELCWEKEQEKLFSVWPHNSSPR